MKNHLFTSMLILFAMGATAQTKNNTTCVTAGFGFQQYNGDLGNDFYKIDWTKYGVASTSLGFYLNSPPSKSPVLL